MLESLIWGWHVALSKNNKTWWFCIFILPMKAVNHSSMICDVIHAFLLYLHSTGSFRSPNFGRIVALLPCRSLRVSPFHLTQNHIKKQSLFLCSFPPKHFSPFRHSDLFGSTQKNSLITVCYVFRFISLDYGWQFSYPLPNSLTVYIT